MLQAIMRSLEFFGLLALTFISQATPSSFDDKCLGLLQSAGATSEFGNRVGYAIHSLSIRSLKKFKSDVTENNRIPTINMDLTSDSPILFYAPDRSTPDSGIFKTEYGKIVDEVR